MTKHERQRIDKHKAICREYEELKAEHRDVKPNRLINAIAEAYNMTIQGITKILVANGLYEIKRKEVLHDEK